MSMRITSIHSLNVPRGPSDVASLIVAIYVNAVKCVVGFWLWSDCCKKFLKGFESKLNSSSSVVREIAIVRIGASCFSVFICPHLWGPVIPSGVSVFCTALEKHIKFEAATASRVALSEIGGKHYTIVTTFTKAFPERLLTCVDSNKLDCGESVEFLSTDIIASQTSATLCAFHCQATQPNNNFNTTVTFACPQRIAVVDRSSITNGSQPSIFTIGNVLESECGKIWSHRETLPFSIKWAAWRSEFFRPFAASYHTLPIA